MGNKRSEIPTQGNRGRLPKEVASKDEGNVSFMESALQTEGTARRIVGSL